MNNSNNNVKMVKLGDICTPKQWKTISASKLKKEGYPVFGANGIIGYFDEYNHKNPTVLVTCRGATCGTINISEPYSYVTGNAMCMDDLDPDTVDLKFLYYYFRMRGFYDVISGSAQPQITRAGLLKVQIPLPPLPEQKRIAEILDGADEARRKRRENLSLYDDLIRSLFLKTFGDPDVDCEMTTVDGLIKKEKNSIRTGPFGSQLLHSEFVDEGIAVLGIDNAVKNRFEWSSKRFITEEKYEQLKRYTVHPEDVLITIMGTCGRCAVVPKDIPIAINTKHLCCMSLNKEECVPEFLRACFLFHPSARAYLSRRAKGAIMDGLNMGIIKDLPIPICSLDQQLVFAEQVKEINAQKAREQVLFDGHDDLFNALLQRAFKGEL